MAASRYARANCNCPEHRSIRAFCSASRCHKGKPYGHFSGRHGNTGSSEKSGGRHRTEVRPHRIRVSKIDHLTPHPQRPKNKTPRMEGRVGQVHAGQKVSRSVCFLSFMRRSSRLFFHLNHVFSAVMAQMPGLGFIYFLLQWRAALWQVVKYRQHTLLNLNFVISFQYECCPCIRSAASNSLTSIGSQSTFRANLL